VAQLIIFIPALFASLPVCMRHGFNRSSGWVFTLSLCFIHILGASCQLGTYSNHSASLVRATLVFDGMGLAQLLAATLGLLARVINWIQIDKQELICLRELLLVRALVIIGLILSIIGGATNKINVYDPYHPISASPSSQAAIIFYIISYIGLVYLAFICAKHIASVPFGEKRIGHAVLIAMPLILLRLIYAALDTFRHDKKFNIYNGSVAALVCMALLEEIIVVIIYILLGYVIPLMNPEQQPPSITRDILEEEKPEEVGEQAHQVQDLRHAEGQFADQEIGYTHNHVPAEPEPVYNPPGNLPPGENIENM